MTDYVADVKRYVPNPNEAAVAKIVKHCGIALRKRDSSYVAGSDPKELATVRDSWCKKKLGLTDEKEIDAAIKQVVTTMKGDRDKHRVIFYYLLAQHFNKLESL